MITNRLFELNERESDVLKDVINILLENEYLVIRINSGASKVGNRFIEYYRIMNSNKSSGLPDLLAIKNNSILLIECKSTKGKLRPSQNEFIELASKFNVNILVISDINQLLEYLNSKK